MAIEETHGKLTATKRNTPESKVRRAKAGKAQTLTGRQCCECGVLCEGATSDSDRAGVSQVMVVVEAPSALRVVQQLKVVT